MSPVPDSVMVLVNGVIGREGGFSENIHDSGGPTRWGITEFVARANGYSGDMRLLPREKAIEIYLIRYWIAPGFNEVAAVFPDLAVTMFDIGVNMGQATGVKFLQRALNVLNRGGRDWPDIKVDGGMGNITMAAMDAYFKLRPKGRGTLLNMVRGQRTVRYIEIAEANSTQEDFENGWQSERATI